LCGSSAKIIDTNFNEIPPIKKSFGLHFSDHEYELLPEEPGTFTTLRELFEAAPSKIISIDIKGQHPQLKFDVNNLIKEFKREHLTIWGSMKHSDHKLIGKLNPDVP